MITRPWVTVIIPVYNNFQDARNAVLSVITQSFGNFELVIVDDASSRNIPDSSDLPPDERVRLVRLPENKGPAGARNEGIRQAKGEYIAFLDADDVWHQDKLARHREFILQNPDILKISVTGFSISRPGSSRIEQRIPAEVCGLGDALWGCTNSPGSTIIIHKDVFLDTGYFNEKYRRLEDWEWMLRTAPKYKFFVYPEILSEVHISGYGNADYVINAARLFIADYDQEIKATLGHKGKRTFRATLLINVASSAYRNKRFFLAAACMAWAMIRWRSYNAGMYLKYLGKALGGS